MGIKVQWFKIMRQPSVEIVKYGQNSINSLTLIYYNSVAESFHRHHHSCEKCHTPTRNFIHTIHITNSSNQTAI